MDFDVIKRLLAAFEREQVRYAIFGAVAMGEYPAVQYVPPDGAFHVDIVTRLGEAYAFADLPIARVPFDGLHVSVVTPRGLYEMKRNTVRLKDRADAEALKERFGVRDEGDR